MKDRKNTNRKRIETREKKKETHWHSYKKKSLQLFVSFVMFFPSFLLFLQHCQSFGCMCVVIAIIKISNDFGRIFTWHTLHKLGKFYFGKSALCIELNESWSSILYYNVFAWKASQLTLKHIRILCHEIVETHFSFRYLIFSWHFPSMTDICTVTDNI